MALIKSINTQYGTPAYYWKIVDTNINWLNNTTSVVLAGYTNKESRLTNKVPLETRIFSWEGDKFPFDKDVEENILSVAYSSIKNEKKKISEIENGQVVEKEVDGEFADAQDDL